LQVPAHGKVEVIEWAAQDRPRGQRRAAAHENPAVALAAEDRTRERHEGRLYAGDHTLEVLGYSASRIAELEREGAIRSVDHPSA
jgi:hypothetical protein